jgi:hypothetical protein
MNEAVWNGVVIGHVHNNGCQGTACKARIAEGLPFHATPAGFGKLLRPNHFATEAEARAALLRLARETP